MSKFNNVRWANLEIRMLLIQNLKGKKVFICKILFKHLIHASSFHTTQRNYMSCCAVFWSPMIATSMEPHRPKITKTTRAFSSTTSELLQYHDGRRSSSTPLRQSFVFNTFPMSPDQFTDYLSHDHIVVDIVLHRVTSHSLHWLQACTAVAPNSS